MTAPSESPFVVGLEVAVIRDRTFGSPKTYKKARITSVFTNGNFRVEGSDKRFRQSAPCDYGDDRWRAHQAGASGYGPRAQVELITPALEEEIAASARLHEFLALFAKIERRARVERFTQAQVDAARALVAALEATEKSA